MANRFDRATPQQYVNTYVPLPLDAIGALAKDYNDKYVSGQNMVGELDLFGQQLKNAPMDEALKQSWINDAQTNIKALVEEGQKNHSFANPEFQNKIKNTINMLKSDSRVNTIMLNKQFYDKWVADRAKGIGNDLDFTFETDLSHPTGFKQNIICQGGSCSGKVYNQAKITPYKDLYETKSKIMSGISEDGFSSDSGYDFTKPGTKLDIGADSYTVYNKQTRRWEGLDKRKVEAIAKTSVNLYGNTEAGKWELQKDLDQLFKQKNINRSAYDYDWQKLNALSQNGDKQAQQIVNYFNQKWTNDLFDVARKQIHSKSSSSTDTKEFKLPEEQIISTQDTQHITLSGDPNASNVTFYNPNPNVYVGQPGALSGQTPLAITTSGSTPYNPYNSKDLANVIKTDPTAAKYINTAMNLAGYEDVSNLTPQQQYDIMQSAQKLANYAKIPKEISTNSQSLSSSDDVIVKGQLNKTADQIKTFEDLKNWSGEIYERGENGKLIAKDKSSFNDDALVKIRKYSSQNPFQFANPNISGLGSPFEFVINGTSYVASNPNIQFKTQSGNESAKSTKANYEQLMDNLENQIYSLSLHDDQQTPMRIESINIPGSDKEYKMLYVPRELDNTNNKGGYVIKDLNVQVSSPKEAIQEIAKDIKK